MYNRYAMNKGFTAIKNMVWALAIFVSLGALLIGLSASMIVRGGSQRQSGTMTLGQGVSRGGSDKLDLPDEFEQYNQSSSSSLKLLPSTQDAGLEYALGLTYVCDSTIAGISNYAQNVNAGIVAQVWTDTGSGFPASNAAKTDIIYPNDGSHISVGTASMIAKPSRVVIYIGADNLYDTSSDAFISGYERLIKDIQSSSDSTQIICCGLASVTSGRRGSVDGLDGKLINQANEWIKLICEDTGAFYADLPSVLNDKNGSLNEDYASADGKTLNAQGVGKVIEYFRYHGV